MRRSFQFWQLKRFYRRQAGDMAMHHMAQRQAAIDAAHNRGVYMGGEGAS